MKRPKKDWFVRKAKTNSTCNLCGKPIAKGDSIVRWGSKWPHFQCAKARDAQSCAEN